MKKIFLLLVATLFCATTLVAQEIYSTSFETEDEFKTWTVVDSNADGSTWAFDAYGDPSFVFYTYNSTNAADDWMISPAITSTQAGTLAVSFEVKGSSYGEKLELFYGSEANVDAMTNRLCEPLNLSDSQTSHLYLVEVEADKPIYLGFHACSDADKWRLYLCNVKVQFTSNPVDLQVSEFVAPVSGFGLDKETVTVKVKNVGNVDVESFDVAFAIDETTVAAETVNQALAAGAEMEYTFTATADLSEPRKLFALKAWTSHADDVNPANDACQVEVLHKAPATVPYTMGFEAAEYTDGITFFNLNEDDGDWSLYTDPWWNLARTGDYCLAYNYNKENNADDWAILEPITIPEAGYYVLKFWYSGDDTHPEKLAVCYGSEASPEAMTNKIVEYAPFARSAYEESINIIYIDTPQDIYIGFHAFSDKDENWICVDDVSFEKIDAEAIDIAALSITNPLGFVHKGTKKTVNFKVRNLGIKDATSTVRVKIDETVIYEQEMTVLAQEVKDIVVENAFDNVAAGTHEIFVEVVTDGDVDAENNTQTLSFRMLDAPALSWDFEDGEVPADFTFRVEDEGTVNPGAGAEFNEYGWGIFNIQTHEQFGEYMFAGTTWLDGVEQADRWCILPPFKPTEESFLVWDVASFNEHFLEHYAVMISSNGDDSWYYFTEEEYVAESAEFKTRGIDLSEYSGQSIYIAFRLRSKNCEHLILDNIELYGGSRVELLDVTATVDPAEGRVEKLDKFTVTFNAVESVKLEEYSFYPPYIASVAEDGTLTKIASAQASVVEGEPTQITIAITEEGMTEITEFGKYALVIPRKDLIFNEDPKLLITAQEFVFYYEISDQKEIDYTATIDPAEGVVEMLSDFTITFPNVAQLGWDEYAAKFPYVAIVNADESLTQISATMKFPSDAANSASFGTFAEVTDPGKYAFVVPLESFTFDGQPGEGELIFYYEIEGATPTYTVSVSPAPGEVSAEQMKSFTITFEGVTGIEFNPIGTYGSLYQIDEEGNHLKEYQSAPLIVSENAYTFTPYYPPTEAGKYLLVIPVRAVYFTDANGVYGPNAEHVFDYTLTPSGIEGIAADATDLTVYSIDGVCLLRNAKAADLKNLAKGIYIVNGQKVIIR